MTEPAAKRARADGTMPADLKEEIEKSLPEEGEIEYYTKSHKKQPGPVKHKCLPPEDLVHDKVETVRKGHGHRVHFKCSNAKCPEPIRNDRWETHVLKMVSDRNLQEDPTAVLERSNNFAPDGDWDTKACRMDRVIKFMEQRHYLALARQHGEHDLAQKITDANRFYLSWPGKRRGRFLIVSYMGSHGSLET